MGSGRLQLIASTKSVEKRHYCFSPCGSKLVGFMTIKCALHSLEDKAEMLNRISEMCHFLF